MAKPIATAVVEPAEEQADTEDDEVDDDAGDLRAPSGDRSISARAWVGPAKLFAGDLVAPLQLSVVLAAGYPVRVNSEYVVECGLAASFTSLPYTSRGGMHSSAQAVALLANAAPSREVFPNLSVRGDVGLGLLILSGLDQEGNPFIEGGQSAMGTLAAFHARFAASVDYALSSSLQVTATPLAVSVSPAPSGFKSTISALTTVSFMIGLAYRR